MLSCTWLWRSTQLYHSTPLIEEGPPMLLPNQKADTVTITHFSSSFLLHRCMHVNLRTSTFTLPSPPVPSRSSVPSIQQSVSGIYLTVLFLFPMFEIHAVQNPCPLHHASTSDLSTVTLTHTHTLSLSHTSPLFLHWHWSLCCRSHILSHMNLSRSHTCSCTPHLLGIHPAFFPSPPLHVFS